MQDSHRRSVTLVLGGVRSGKSRFAVGIAPGAQSVKFVATARCNDEEIRRKIERHRAERPAHWETLEEPLKVAESIKAGDQPCDLVLIDCLTMFAANLMGTHGNNNSAIVAAIEKLCGALRQSDRSVLLISNEVGSGIIPAYASGRQFRDLLGGLNQRVAEIADNVVLMIAGLPLAIKGSLEVLR